MFKLHCDYCQYSSNISTVLKYLLCHITAAVLHYDYYNVYYNCNSVTTTSLHYYHTTFFSDMLRQWSIPIIVATTTLVHHCSTPVRNYSYNTTTDALQFDGINTTSGYGSSGLFLLQYYIATTKPSAR
eukprot:1134873-Pyramimonas_sp.AAC.1